MENCEQVKSEKVHNDLYRISAGQNEDPPRRNGLFSITENLKLQRQHAHGM